MKCGECGQEIERPQNLADILSASQLREARVIAKNNDLERELDGYRELFADLKRLLGLERATTGEVYHAVRALRDSAAVVHDAEGEKMYDDAVRRQRQILCKKLYEVIDALGGEMPTIL